MGTVYEGDENTMIVEVFGPEPPCPRCMRTLEIVKQAVEDLQLNCEVKKIDAYSKSTIAKYGLVFTPAVAVDGKVFVAGRIPSPDEVKRILHGLQHQEGGNKMITDKVRVEIYEGDPLTSCYSVLEQPLRLGS